MHSVTVRAFCGHCGEPTLHSPLDAESFACAVCGAVQNRIG